VNNDIYAHTDIYIQTLHANVARVSHTEKVHAAVAAWAPARRPGAELDPITAKED
jgi:hypothetical protein